MKFTEKRNRFYPTTYVGYKNNFIHKISCSGGWYYVVINHTKKDIRFNSLWVNISFETLHDAKDFCEKYNYKKYNCLGDDINS